MSRTIGMIAMPFGESGLVSYQKIVVKKTMLLHDKPVRMRKYLDSTGPINKTRFDCAWTNIFF